MDSIPLIKKDIETMSDSIKQIKDDMKQHRDDTALRHREFQDFKEELFDRLDNRYAGKWTERTLVWVWWTIGLTLIWAIMSLILIK